MLQKSLSDLDKVVAIGGGHGLGRVLSSLSFLGSRLTGIVTTTDNGGSTGRLRSSENCIAWGDVRNCINQLVTQPDIGSLLFEYRFKNEGELKNHNLGNLMLVALDNLCVRPLDAVNLIRNMLHIECQLIPMSEQPSDLIAVTPCGNDVHGEVSVDKMREFPNQLTVHPNVAATFEAVQAIEKADLILLGPGSFLTSIMPPLLLKDIQKALRRSNAKVIYLGNLQQEVGPASKIPLQERLQWCEKKLGFPIISAVIQDIDKQSELTYPTYTHDLREDINKHYHDRVKLKEAIESVVNHILTPAH
ncbi:LPPG:FO 2-phospho-L-lactate transferase like, CofD-like [Moritella sp. JT01]|uniref:gluconeogenesis factor YvcK family protein n=1 Tax=Moritella sp. JT01 TaxID=756698 RepID=UPI0007942A2E|nr:uridine diphosphate-N-acetylglucosamine-binding protein YvcK [Moritella sp. JT01]KXO08282.1 LPPG:FO 2-phospho-L-lactate transferase like, CofD-like [Moritella sp. JT01]